MFAQAFVIEKEERLIMSVIHMWNHNRRADRAPILIEIIVWQLLAGAVIEEVVGVEMIVAEEFVGAAVKLVGPRLGDDNSPRLRRYVRIRR